MKYLQNLFFFTLFVLFCSCENEAIGTAADCEFVEFSEFNQVQELFFDVAYNQEFGDNSQRLRKWRGDIRYFVTGNTTPEILDEVNIIIAEINSTSTTQQLIEVTTQAQANLIIFYGSPQEYITQIEPEAQGFIDGANGFVSIFWDTTFEIVEASVFVDSFSVQDFDNLAHITREEIAQSLGLINDTFVSDDSIFHQFFQNNNYSQEDLLIIGEMLSDNLRGGMCPAEALPIFE